MNIFNRLNKFRTEVQDRILQNQEILKLLRYSTENALKKPNISIDDAWNMVGEKKVDPKTGEEKGGYIFFQPRATETIQDDKSILTMTMSGKGNNIHYADVNLTFIILVNYSSNELIDGTYRLYRICEKLVDLFGDTRSSWMGKMQFKNFSDITAPASYHALGVSFTVSDFK